MKKTILLLITFLLSLPITGYARPKIGLVLSGGGARGGAHLGVIQAFEENNIPIDAIVGTSMGSMIGGLYASGMTTDELYEMLTKTNWDKKITITYERELTPFRRKSLERDFPGRLKLGMNSQYKLDTGTGLFKRQMMLQFLKEKTTPVSHVKNFDELDIPFRAIATNLLNGETVSLGTGNIAEAIYASISVPGGFEPITLNGQLLVDGGVSDNLPIDVMRQEMGVDIIIAIDIGTPFDENAQFTNLLAVIGQLSNILMRKNADNIILTLKDNEILITPDLTGFTPLDVDKYPQIVKIGYETAKAKYKSKLAPFTLPSKEYLAYSQKHRTKPQYTPPIVTAIELDNQSTINNKTIMGYLDKHLNNPLDIKQLNTDLMAIYSMGLFDDVTYEIIKNKRNTTLKVKAVPSWDSKGQLKFAFGFEDNFTGDSDYSVRAEYIAFGLNSYDGEIRARFAIGQEKLALIEWYQPLTSSHLFYLQPDIFYRDIKIHISPTILGQHQVQADLDDSITGHAIEYGGTLGLGLNISRNIQFETGTQMKMVKPSIDMLYQDINGDLLFVSKHTKQKSAVAYANLKYDSMNHPFFPKQGHWSELRWSKHIDQLETELDFAQFSILAEGAYTIGASTILPRIKYGTTFHTEGFDESQDFSSFYTLGGLFKLSGLPSNAISGDHAVFGALIFRYNISDSYFFGSLGMPFYAGFSLEAGETWYHEYNQEYDSENLIYAGSVYLASDTILGPIHLGLGMADSDENQYYSVYFSLGGTF